MYHIMKITKDSLTVAKRYKTLKATIRNAKKLAEKATPDYCYLVATENTLETHKRVWNNALSGNIKVQEYIVSCHISLGNKKVPKTTGIFNFTNARKCPSRLKGLCKLGEKCYALKAERIYPQSVIYRARQAFIWKHFPKALSGGIATLINSGKIDKIRFSEAGDFPSQQSVEEFANQVKILKTSFPSFPVYGYTARKDLNLKSLKDAGVVVRSSGFESENTFPFNAVESLSDGKVHCKGDCNTCSLCLTFKGEIEVKMH